MLFFSQSGEDLFLLKNLINKKCSSGVFIEVGALDGVQYSNTGFLEQELGFSGILIEPSKHFKKLVQNRPKCACVHKAIAAAPGKMLFKDDWARSGLVDTMPEEFLHTQYHAEHLDENSCINDIFYEVDTVPLRDVIREHNVQYIDFMSIDTEGGELGVLQSMDWDIPTYVICIELDGKNAEKDDACRHILAQHGFTFHTRLCANEFYVNTSYFRKNELYDLLHPYIDLNSYKELWEIGSFWKLEPCCYDEVHRAILG